MMNKRILLQVLGMAAMGESIMLGSQGGLSSHSPTTVRLPQTNYKNNVAELESFNRVEQFVELQARSQKFALQMDGWNKKPISKPKEFTIQGFFIQGVSEKSASKRLRKFLSMSGLHPNTKLQELQDKLNEIKPKI